MIYTWIDSLNINFTSQIVQNVEGAMLHSPPGRNSMTKYKNCPSWNEKYILTTQGFSASARMSLSALT